MFSRLAAQRVLLCAVLAYFAFPLAGDEQAFCIAGSVLNAVTGEPLRRAAVIIPQASPQSAALTDAAGAFRFCGLGAGNYLATAEKPGFAPLGQKLVIGPTREDLALRLQPLSAAGGKITDAGGEPLQGVLVQLLSIHVVEGRRKVSVEETAASDDRGEYRFAGLSPGRYYLRAAGWKVPADVPDENESFAPVYYGGATSLASASPVTIAPGRDLQADFSIAPHAAYNLRGSMAGFSPLIPATIGLFGAEGEPSGAPVTLDAATGAFQFKLVVPGNYLLLASQGEGVLRKSGERTVQVRGDANGVSVPLAGSALLRGMVRVASDTPTGTPAAPRCAIRISPTNDWLSERDHHETETESSGEFEMVGVAPGRYSLRMDCAGGYVAAAHLGEADLLANPEFVVVSSAAALEAVLASDGGTLEITASDDGQSGPAWVLLVPAAGPGIHTRLGRLETKLTLSDIAPGDYQVFAWSGSPELFDYASPDVRQQWSGRSVSVHVGARDRLTVKVKVAPGDTP